MEYGASRTCAGLSTALSLRLAAVAANPHSSRNRHNGCGRRRKFLLLVWAAGRRFRGIYCFGGDEVRPISGSILRPNFRIGAAGNPINPSCERVPIHVGESGVHDRAEEAPLRWNRQLPRREKLGLEQKEPEQRARDRRPTSSLSLRKPRQTRQRTGPQPTAAPLRTPQLRRAYRSAVRQPRPASSKPAAATRTAVNFCTLLHWQQTQAAMGAKKQAFLFSGIELRNQECLFLRSEESESVFLAGRCYFCFCLRDDAQRFGISLFAFARFAPHLLSAVKLLLRTRHVDLFRLQRIAGQDGHAVGQHFHKAPAHVVARRIRPGRFKSHSGMHAHIARAQLRHQRRMAVQHLEIPCLRRQLNRRCRLIEEGAFRRHQPHTELVCILCHKCLSRGTKGLGTKNQTNSPRNMFLPVPMSLVPKSLSFTPLPSTARPLPAHPRWSPAYRTPVRGCRRTCLR